MEIIDGDPVVAFQLCTFLLVQVQSNFRITPLASLKY